MNHSCNDFRTIRSDDLPVLASDHDLALALERLFLAGDVPAATAPETTYTEADDAELARGFGEEE